MNEEQELNTSVWQNKDGQGFSSRTPVENGSVWLRFTEIVFGRNSVECVLDIRLDIKKKDGSIVELPKFSQRIDLRSSSARKALATELNAAYGGKRDGYNWVLTLNVIFNQVVDKIYDVQHPVSTEDMLSAPPGFLLSPFLQEGAPNLLFARSEAGKTWLALYMAVCAANELPFLGYSAQKKARVLFLDYEDELSSFASRLRKIVGGLNISYKESVAHIHYFKPRGALRSMTESIKKMVAKGGYDLIIIDAGGDATGGSPSDEEKVLDFFLALDEIPCTKLILHHEPKYVVDSASAFYGSMYWRARARVGWRLEVVNENHEEKTIKASIQKRSNLPYYDPIFYKMVFNTASFEDHLNGADPLDSSNDSVVFELTDKRRVLNIPAQLTVQHALSEHGDLTTAQISDLTDNALSHVKQSLYDLEAQGMVRRKKSGRTFLWTLKEADTA